jgi:uncharacterized protein (TIGR00725 family)
VSPRGSFKKSAPNQPLRIGVIGSGSVSASTGELAKEVGSAIARAEAIVVCGGLGGVMAAAAAGAAEEGGVVIGILPGSDPTDAAPGVSIPLPTGLGEARNVLVVRSSEAVIAIAGEWGTLSEAAFCRKFHVPLIGLETGLPSDVLEEIASGPSEAVARAVELAHARRRSLP